MTVRQSLLAILELGPCYGYQLRVEFERRTGGTWPLNVGQVYTTLDRLSRDGLVASAGADDAGHVVYEITSAGRAEARSWLSTAVERPLAARDEVAVKLALAVTLPGADAAAIVAAQRSATTAALAGYRAALRAEPGAGDAAEPRVDRAALARTLVVDSLVSAAEAELAWLDRCEARLAQAVPYPLDAEPPRRGRPAKV